MRWRRHTLRSTSTKKNTPLDPFARPLTMGPICGLSLFYLLAQYTIFVWAPYNLSLIS